MSGVDRDADHALGANEVSSSVDVCAPTHAALARIDDVAPGSACGAGGTKVVSGRDAN